MPRARTTESEDVVVVKKPRAPRARATSVDGESAAPRKRAPRKTAPKKVAPVSELAAEPTPPQTQQRKAPTPIAAERRTRVRNTRALIAVVTFCVLLSGVGVTVGLFDHGAIDVVAVVNNRNEKISRGEVRDANGQTVTNSVPVQIDGSGLHVADPSTAVTPTPMPLPETTIPAEVAGTSTATSTAATSSESTTRDPALKPAL